jgi:hypothetical protein
LIFIFIFDFFGVLQHPDPIGNGLGDEAIVEAAGPECIIPGQMTPIKVLGLKVPILFLFQFFVSEIKSNYVKFICLMVFN